MVCMPENGDPVGTFTTLDELAVGRADGTWSFSRNPPYPCNCPCEAMVDIERPSVAILTLAHVAQNLVVVIVGINLGFRGDALDSWADLLRKASKTFSSASVPQPVVLSEVPMDSNACSSTAC